MARGGDAREQWTGPARPAERQLRSGERAGRAGDALLPQLDHHRQTAE